MDNSKTVIMQHLGRPIANTNFFVMRHYIRLAQRRGIGMVHTARPFSYYRKVLYKGQTKSKVLEYLQGKRVVDVGCGYTPYAKDSLFRACHDAGIEFYGVDPLIAANINFGIKERALALATGGSGHFSPHAPGLSKALSAEAQELPFEDQSVDEILSCYLMFIWIENEDMLADIFREILRVLKPGGLVKLYPLYEWRLMRLNNKRLKSVLSNFKIEQTFVHGGMDFRIIPSMSTALTKL